MITNDIKQLKKDYKSLRDDFENKTNFKIEFIEMPSNFAGKADCSPDFNNKILKVRLRKGLIENDYIHVVHELFHGILWIKEGFSCVSLQDKKYEGTEIMVVRNIISTYVDDMVVHKRLFSLGYNPIDPIWSSDVKNNDIQENLRLIQQGNSHLAINKYCGIRLWGNLLILFRALYYIVIKDFRKNYKDCFHKNIFKNLKKLIKIFPYKNSFKYIREIEKLLKKHDIHSASGNDIIKKEIIKMTGLENDIVVRKISVEE